MSDEVLAVGTQLVDGHSITHMKWDGERWCAIASNGAVYAQHYAELGLYGTDAGLTTPSGVRILWPPPPLKAGDVVSVEGRVERVNDDGTIRLTRIEGSASYDLGVRNFADEDVTFVRRGQPGEPYVEPEVLAVGMRLMDLGPIVEMAYSERLGGWYALNDGPAGCRWVSQAGLPGGLLTVDRGLLPWPPKPEAKS